MSVALTDILLELADPAKLAQFNQDPSGYLENSVLTSEEKTVLLNRDMRRIGVNAQSMEGHDKTQQFNRHAVDVLIEIDPVVELHLSNEQVTVAGQGMTFVDENGLLYRAIAK
jgi:hypothetical protein